MAKEKMMNLVGVLLFYFLIVLGVVMVNQGLGRVTDTNNVSVTN